MSLKVGVQLYSVRNEMMKDPIGTIESVAKAGYKYLEAANHNALEDFGVGFGVDAKTLKSVLDDQGSGIVSAHIFPFTADNTKELIEYNHILGNNYIVYPMDFYGGYDEVQRKVEMMNSVGKIFRAEGISLLYHNHFHEFQKFGDKTVFQMIYENTDPDYLGFELDTFWSMRGGQNPLEVMDYLGQRLKLVHQKDYLPADGYPKVIFDRLGYDAKIDMDVFNSGYSEKEFTEIGTGSMDIQAIIDKANALGSVDYIILEQDYSQHPELESIRLSMDSFKKFNGISWK